MSALIPFLVGLFIGAAVGLFSAVLAVAASKWDDSDNDEER